ASHWAACIRARPVRAAGLSSLRMWPRLFHPQASFVKSFCLPFLLLRNPLRLVSPMPEGVFNIACAFPFFRLNPGYFNLATEVTATTTLSRPASTPNLGSESTQVDLA